ncbi:MAG: NfeD family protein [Actinomycetota bacterium]|nr:NfeD family protein [Actinomycetota bacterium]
MWVVAGVLLGIVVLATLVGFHVGPHAHAVAGIAGAAAAAWLAFMLVDGATRPLLVALLAADVVVSGGVGFAAWRVLSLRRSAGPEHSTRRLEAAMGVAVGPLDPTGVVRVKGESWSATSLNGPVRDGASVQVISVDGIRLNVWGEDSSPLPVADAPAARPGEAGPSHPTTAARQEPGPAPQSPTGRDDT